MSVVLDTNQLPQNGDPQALSLQLLRSVASEHGLALVVPELVVVEWASKVRRDAQTAWNQANAALRKAARFGPVPDLPPIDLDTLVDERRTALEGVVDVIEMPAGCWEEALRREADRVPPTREGSGARDAAIWLSSLAHAQQRAPDACYLVTANTKDFCHPDDKNALHPDLVAELGHDASLELVTDADLMLGRLAEPVEPFLTVEELAANPSIAGPVIAALDTAVLNGLEIDALFGDGTRFLAGPVTATPTRIAEQKAYEVAGAPVALVEVDYELSGAVGALRRRATRGMSQVQADVTVQLPVRLWLKGTGPDSESELVWVGPAKVG